MNRLGKTRRDFLRQTFYATLSFQGVSFASLHFNKVPILLGDNGKSLIVSQENGSLLKSIRLTHSIHHIVGNFASDGEILAVSSGLRLATLLNLNNLGDLRVFECTPKHTFGGHAAFSRNGKIFVTSETQEESSEGIIVVRDVRTLKVIQTFSSYGKFPHEVCFTDLDELIVTSNALCLGNEKSCVVFLESKTGKLKEKYTPPSKMDSLAHFAIGKNGIFLVNGGLIETPGSAKILLGKRGDFSLKSVRLPNQTSQYLSVSIHPLSQIAGVTDTINNEVLFINLKSGKYIKSIKLTGTKGITLTSDNQYFVANDNMGRLYFINSKTLSLDEMQSRRQSEMTGSHLTWLNS